MAVWRDYHALAGYGVTPSEAIAQAEYLCSGHPDVLTEYYDWLCACICRKCAAEAARRRGA